MARPIKLTKKLIKEVCTYIENGLSNVDACRMVNINESTFYEYIKRGNDPKEKNCIFSEFNKSIKKALIKFKLYHLQKIRIAGDSGTWQASAWLMERKFKEEFGRFEKVEHSGKIKHGISIEEMHRRAMEYERAMAEKKGKARNNS